MYTLHANVTFYPTSWAFLPGTFVNPSKYHLEHIPCKCYFFLLPAQLGHQAPRKEMVNGLYCPESSKMQGCLRIWGGFNATVIQSCTAAQFYSLYLHNIKFHSDLRESTPGSGNAGSNPSPLHVETVASASNEFTTAGHFGGLFLHNNNSNSGILQAHMAPQKMVMLPLPDRPKKKVGF